MRAAWILVLALVAEGCVFDPPALTPLSGDAGGTPVDSGVFRFDTGVLLDSGVPDGDTPALCGDGIVIGPTEACDDANTMSGDGCSQDCALEPGYDCPGQPSMCTNPPPTARDDRLRTREETSAELDVLANDLDVRGDVLTLVDTTTPALGRLTRSPGGLTFTPRLDAYGRDAFRYTVRDTAGNTATASVTITIDPVNDAPRTGDLTLRTAFDSGVDVRFDAFDADGHTLRYSTTRPAHGTLGLIDQIGASVRYTPSRGFVGVDVFTYRASDGSGLMSRTASVTIVVLPADWRVPDAELRRPVCVDGSTLTAELADLPVLLRAPAGSLPGAGAGGADLVFQGASGGRLVHDVERWAPDATSLIWIRVPRVGTTTTCFSVYFGRASPGPGPDAAEVWSRGFTSVLHLDGSGRDVRRGQPIQLTGTTTTPGAVGDGRAFDGSGYADLGSGLLESQRGTISAWIRVDPALDLLDQALIVYGTGALVGARQGFDREELHLGLDTDEHLRFFVWGSTVTDVVAPVRVTTGDWRSVAVAWERGADAVVYVDGVERARAPHAGEPFDTGVLVRVAAPFDPSVRLFTGALDEVRTSSVPRDAAWLRGERASVALPDFVFLGPLDDGVR